MEKETSNLTQSQIDELYIIAALKRDYNIENKTTFRKVLHYDIDNIGINYNEHAWIPMFEAPKPLLHHNAHDVLNCVNLCIPGEDRKLYGYNYQDLWKYLFSKGVTFEIAYFIICFPKSLGSGIHLKHDFIQNSLPFTRILTALINPEQFQGSIIDCNVKKMCDAETMYINDKTQLSLSYAYEFVKNEKITVVMHIKDIFYPEVSIDIERTYSGNKFFDYLEMMVYNPETQS